MSEHRESVVGPEGVASTIASLAGQLSSVEKNTNSSIEGLRREMLLEVGQVTQLIIEWRVAHEAVHVQQHRAIDAAVSSLDKRLEGLNELRKVVVERDKAYATIAALAGVQLAIESEKVDTRLRFERIESRLNDMVTSLSREARNEGRPGQDLKNSQAAIIAAVLFAVAVIGIIIAIANIATAR